MQSDRPDPSLSVTLQRHPASQAGGAASAAVNVRRCASYRLRLRYRLRGDPQRIVWPEPGARSLRLDQLWRATCCEVFLQRAGDVSYREWNFSPAGHWQAYDFDQRRTGQRPAQAALPAMDIGTPHARAPDLTEWLLTAEIDVPADPLLLGLTLVVADRHGRLDYWALAHSSAQPDFHDPDTWTLRV